MSATLPISPSENCCVVPCDEVVVAQLIGPSGASAYAIAVQQGFVGTEAQWLASLIGEDGLSSMTFTTAQFTVPAELATVVINVIDSSILAIGQISYIQNAGWYRVTAIPSPTQLTVRNLEDSATGVYAENVAPATVVASGSKVSPGGLQGPSGGTPAGTAFAIANNLSEANAANVRNNLGLVIGTNVQAFDADLTTWAGITPSVNVQSVVSAANYAAIRTLLALVPGTDIQAFDAFLLSIAALGTAADRMIYTTAVDTAAEAILTTAGRAILDDVDAVAQRATLGGILPRYGLLGSLIGADMNSTGDQVITIESGVTKYIIRRIVVTNASISLTTAAGGIYTNAAKAGTVVVAAAQVYSALTAAAKFKDLTLEAVVGTDILTATMIYLSLTTPQGAASTANIYIFGENVT